MTALGYLELALSVLGAYTLVSLLVMACWVGMCLLSRAHAAHERGVERVRAHEVRQARLRLITSPEPDHYQGGAA